MLKVLVLFGLGAFALHEKSRADRLQGQVDSLEKSLRGSQKTVGILSYVLGKERGIREGRDF